MRPVERGAAGPDSEQRTLCPCRGAWLCSSSSQDGAFEKGSVVMGLKKVTLEAEAHQTGDTGTVTMAAPPACVVTDPRGPSTDPELCVCVGHAAAECTRVLPRHRGLLTSCPVSLYKFHAHHSCFCSTVECGLSHFTLQLPFLSARFP